MEEPLVSIIVPVYNAAPYLSRCVESLTKQSYQAIELIFVDDGSSDCSLRILLDEQKRDSRIIVLQQTNAGPSAARNAGLDIAKGKYIMFCDSDDAVATNWCQKMVAAIIEYPDAFIVCGFYRLDESGNICCKHSIDAGIYEKEQYYKLYLPGLSGSSCNKIYHRSIVQEQTIRFDTSRKYAEDAVFNLQYFNFMDHFLVIEDCLYNYYSYTTKDTLSSNVSYFQLRDIFDIRLNYISAEFLSEFKYSFWLNAWSKFQEALNNKCVTCIPRIKNAHAISKDAVFQELLSQFGAQALDKRSLALLQRQRIISFCTLQYIAKAKRFFKIPIKLTHLKLGR